MIMDLNLDRRRLIIIIVIVAILLLVAIVGGLWYWRGLAKVGEPTTQAPPVFNTLPPQKTQPVPIRTAEEERQETVSRLARLFAERFGTFSNQSRYEGITDIMAVTTDSFQTWLRETYLPKIKQDNSGLAYAGQTTRVMSVTIDKISDADAQVTVHVQRAMTSELATEAQYPILKLSLIRSDNIWLVDSAHWDKNQ